MNPSRHVLSFFFVLLPALFAVPIFGELSAERPAEKKSLFVVPVVYYTPETRIAGGLTGIWAFRLAGGGPPAPSSSLRTALIYTQNKQTQLQLYWDLVISGQRLRVNGDLRYARYPQQFYGIGPDTGEKDQETYSSDTLKFRLNLDRQIVAGWHAGLHLEWNQETIGQVLPGGLLEGGRIPGASGGTLSGFGVYGGRDTRNSTYAPSRGHYLRLEWDLFPTWLGSDYSCSLFTLDGRGYLPLTARQQLACQLLVLGGTGTVPFQLMPGLGGQNLLRGIYLGRFRDRSLLAIQADWRVAFGARFGGVAFAGLGQVASRPGLLDFTRARFTFGGGLRYLFSPRDGIGLRVDCGFFAGKPAFYLTVGEAF